jgi:hypothetical protein
MAIQNLQASSAIEVIPSDTINIPNPAAKVASGAQDGTPTLNELRDSTATFTSTVKKGDIVYDTDGLAIATVDSVDSDTQLTLSANIFTATENYAIYDHTAKSNPSLYIGVAGDVSVEMAGTGAAIVYKGVAAGSTLPINVTRVNSTASRHLFCPCCLFSS